MYSPEILALTVSRQCNIECAHCIVEAGPRQKGVLDPNIAGRALQEARENGIEHAVIFGGEPFLFVKSYLPRIIHQALLNKLDVTVGTNGFWGKNEAFARKTLQDMENLAKSYTERLAISISVDQYHQPYVPATSVANIITQFRFGDFPHLTLGVQTFREKESWEALDQVYQACHRQGVHLMECNDIGYIYPALPSELIEFTPENYPSLATKLDLPKDADDYRIKMAIAIQFKLRQQYQVAPNVIARKLDIGKGVHPYTIFPEKRYLVDLCVEQSVIKAGGARNGSPLELCLKYGEKIDYLVISPDGQAYSHPAQITAQEGIVIGNKPLSQVIQEVGTYL